MSDSGSVIEIKSALPKITKKQPKSPTDLRNKKTTTKMMIIDALTELKTRKGVSLYAIKKFLMEKYDVDTARVNYFIKKSIKAGVEDGTFVQMKGIGASGSFKLATVKPEKKPKKMEKNKKPKTKKEKNEKTEVEKKEKKKVKKTDKEKQENKEQEKPKKKLTKEKSTKEKMPKVKEKKPKNEVKKKVKIAKGLQTPAKKRAVNMKRKSIGSIIKPPKMKPKLQA